MISQISAKTGAVLEAELVRNAQDVSAEVTANIRSFEELGMLNVIDLSLK
jgi:hypothetical protein